MHGGGSAVPGPHPPSSGLMQDPRAVAAMWGLNIAQFRMVILSVDVIIETLLKLMLLLKDDNDYIR